MRYCDRQQSEKKVTAGISLSIPYIAIIRCPLELIFWVTYLWERPECRNKNNVPGV